MVRGTASAAKEPYGYVSERFRGDQVIAWENVLVFTDETGKTIYVGNMMGGPIMVGDTTGKEVKFLLMIGENAFVEYNEQPKKRRKKRASKKKK